MPRRGIVIVVLLIAAAGSGLLLASGRAGDQANILAVWRFERANANADAEGPVALLWSIETYNNTLSVEGPAGAAAPDALRIVSPGGSATAPAPMVPLDPAVNISVCAGRRPPRGAMWWSGQVTAEMANDLRERGTTAYRVEVRVRDAWRPATLIDSGCRGVGRG
jgi:hypothetical protein